MANTPHSITIEIMPDGKVKGEVKGVKGKKCAPLSAWLDELGNVLEDRQTPDYHKPEDQNLTLKH